MVIKTERRMTFTFNSNLFALVGGRGGAWAPSLKGNMGMTN